MTTKAQIDKESKKAFNAAMLAKGFNSEKGFYFWRKRGPLYDVLWSEILSSRQEMRIYVTILSPWIDNSNGVFEKFPISTSTIGGTLGPSFPESMTDGHLFSIGDNEQILASFQEILSLMDEKVIPWFDSIISYESFVYYLGRRGCHPTPAYREKIKAGIALGFERESI
jgi:hypothetical protein